jgi:hypothetical protein
MKDLLLAQRNLLLDIAEDLTVPMRKTYESGKMTVEGYRVFLRSLEPIHKRITEIDSLLMEYDKD